MGGATVIILVQSVIILLGVGCGVLGWWCAWRFFKAAQILTRSNESLEASCKKFVAQITEYSDSNDRLRAQLAQIPLAPKPKKIEDAVIRANSSAQVRQLTEHQWGAKPGDNNEQPAS